MPAASRQNPLRSGVVVGGMRHDYPSMLPIEEGTEGYFTRIELLERSGLTQHEYRKLVARRALVAKFKSRQRGWALYTDEDVAAVKAILRKWMPREVAPSPRPRKWQPDVVPAKGQLRYSKDNAREVVKRLRAGVPRDEIFLELDLHPDTIALISRDYEIMIGGFYVDGTMVERINHLPIEGVELPISTARDLMALVDALIAEKKCAACEENPPSIKCTSCVRKSVHAEMARRAREAAPSSAPPPNHAPDAAAE